MREGGARRAAIVLCFGGNKFLARYPARDFLSFFARSLPFRAGPRPRPCPVPRPDVRRLQESIPARGLEYDSSVFAAIFLVWSAESWLHCFSTPAPPRDKLSVQLARL